MNAPGYGSVTARIRLKICREVCGHAMRPSSGFRPPKQVARDSSCGVSRTLPASSPPIWRASTRRAQGRTLRNASSAVSRGLRFTPFWSMIAPASARATIRCSVMPMRGSPWSTAQLIGARPR
ncbi:MAG: hypothetical protein NT173_12580 [Opitutales bacterium]|nr:hypothetical protein [Opitutales bacterium]